MRKIAVIFIVIVLTLIGVRIITNRKEQNKNISSPEVILQKADSGKLISEVYYQCKNGKTIKALYYKGGDVSITPGQPPQPLGRVELLLDNERKPSLKQTISGSGIRYANEDESVVFWSKGETAFMTENDIETYTGCIERIWTVGNEQVDNAVTDFLLSTGKLSWRTNPDSRNICIYQNLYPEKELFPHYLWVRCGEFKMESGELKELSGTSVPVKLDYPNELSYYDQSKFTITIPRDGSLYDGDIKKIFPSEIRDRLNFESGLLNEKIKEKALDDFNNN